MRKSLLIWLLVLIAVAATEPVYKVNFNLDRDDSVELVDLELLFFSPSSLVTEGEYTISELNSKGEILYNMSFSPNFMVLSDPPVDIDVQPILFFVPYSKDAKYITINHNEKEIFKQDLNILCNKDGTCGKFETFLSCPEDCTQKNDKICVPARNGVCDPQCSGDVDPDCFSWSRIPGWILVGIVLVVSIGGILIYKFISKT